MITEQFCFIIIQSKNKFEEMKSMNDVQPLQSIAKYPEYFLDRT